MFLVFRTGFLAKSWMSWVASDSLGRQKYVEGLDENLGRSETDFWA